MAIRRCPYCKAIIDEGLEYCSNCGTQLIFPEDEFIEEEIPGEKIVDVGEEDAEPEEEKEEDTEEEKDLSAATDETEMKKPDVIAEEEIAQMKRKIIPDTERNSLTAKRTDRVNQVRSRKKEDLEEEDLSGKEELEED